MIRVILADSDVPDVELERQELEQEGIELIVAPSADVEDVVGAASDAQGVLVMWSRVDRQVMTMLPQLRVIGRFGTGVDVIDVEEATQRGIAVVNSGHYATEEVAAHAVALSLALLRRVCALDRHVRRGEWDPIGGAAGMRRLSTLRAGVIGLGHIGERVARALQALGLDVAGFDEATFPAGIERTATLSQLLERSDLVSIHVPLLPATRTLMEASALARMPDGAFLVNTARGAIVDEEALIEALQRGKLAGAALDVFEDEPLSVDSPLREMENVVLTPHVAYYSEEALLEARLRTVRSLAAVLTGREAPDLVNPDYSLATR